MSATSVTERIPCVAVPPSLGGSPHCPEEDSVKKWHVTGGNEEPVCADQTRADPDAGEHSLVEVRILYYQNAVGNRNGSADRFGATANDHDDPYTRFCRIPYGVVDQRAAVKQS